MSMTLRQTLEHLIACMHIAPDDAKLIIMAACDMDYTALTLNMNSKLEQATLAQIETLVNRLAKGEPIQYVLGHWAFIDLDLMVDRRALIPRPETELLAEKAVHYLTERSNPRVIDIGCGTGCIGLYIKHAIINADVTLCDISEDALALSKENAKMLGLDVAFIHRDMRKLGDIGDFDLIVSNPPYIGSTDMATLDKNVQDYEPHLALDGGEDGLMYYRALHAIAKNHLKFGCMLAVEVGFNQAPYVAELFKQSLVDVTIHKDLEGIDRMVTACRSR